MAYAASALDRTAQAEFHRFCTMYACDLEHLDEKAYVTCHTEECSVVDCQSVNPVTKHGLSIEAVLKANRIPVIVYDDELETFVATNTTFGDTPLYDAVESVEYVRISHVWSE